MCYETKYKMYRCFPNPTFMAMPIYIGGNFTFIFLLRAWFCTNYPYIVMIIFKSYGIVETGDSSPNFTWKSVKSAKKSLK